MLEEIALIPRPMEHAQDEDTASLLCNTVYDHIRLFDQRPPIITKIGAGSADKWRIGEQFDGRFEIVKQL